MYTPILVIVGCLVITIWYPSKSKPEKAKYDPLFEIHEPGGSCTEKDMGTQLTIGGNGAYQEYLCDPKTKTWIVDDAAAMRRHEYYKHLDQLRFDLQSRILNDEEMAEVQRLGPILFVRYGEQYFEKDKQKQLK